MALVRLGWDMYNLLAASVMVPVSATVIAYFNCCNVIFNFLYLHTIICMVTFFVIFFHMFSQSPIISHNLFLCFMISGYLFHIYITICIYFSYLYISITTYTHFYNTYKYVF